MTTTPTESDSKPSTQWLKGLGLVLLATLALSLQNVIARIATSPAPIPILGGIFQLGGYIAPDADKLQVSLLVLLLRVTCVVPLLWLVLPIIKPGAWQEAKDVIIGEDRGLKLRIMTAGLLLFLSQTGTYLAIREVGPAIAVTIFFIYPTVTTLLAWKIFKDKPSWQQWVAIGLIYSGCTWLSFAPKPQQKTASPAAVSSVTMTTPTKVKGVPVAPANAPSISPNPALKSNAPKSGISPLGVIEAMLAGIVFAMEGIIAQSCFSKVNPAVFTGMIFSVEWVALLAVTIPFNHVPVNTGLMLMGGLLSLATLSGYLFNNFGIRAIGAASTAVIGSSGPAVTAILALVIIGDLLSLQNWLAILVVTIGVVLMNIAKAMKKS